MPFTINFLNGCRIEPWLNISIYVTCTMTSGVKIILHYVNKNVTGRFGKYRPSMAIQMKVEIKGGSKSLKIMPMV